MNRSVDVRLLGPGDADTLRAMLGLFGREFADPTAYIANQPDDTYLASLLARDTFIAVSATMDGVVIGGLAGYVLPKFEQARSELYIYDLAVDAAYRRKGVASHLIRCLQEFALVHGIYVIFVQADHGDDPAISLYTKLGSREDVIHFDILPARIPTDAQTS
jgi:aminoglycoside 3-N-acetyltransferase I